MKVVINGKEYVNKDILDDREEKIRTLLNTDISCPHCNERWLFRYLDYHLKNECKKVKR